MEEWERAFAEKSERRRRRSLRRRYIRRASLIALISIAILAGLWLVNTSLAFML